MKKSEYLTIAQLAKILGISRIAVYNKVKKDQIKATKVGKTYIILQKDLGSILGRELSQKDKLKITAAVEKTVKEYGEVLKMLGSE